MTTLSTLYLIMSVSQSRMSSTFSSLYTTPTSETRSSLRAPPRCLPYILSSLPFFPPLPLPFSSIPLPPLPSLAAKRTLKSS